MTASYGIGIVGTGAALGSRLLTNEELCSATLHSTTPEWILEKTGIQRRYLVAPGESAATLALGASRAALEAAGIGPQDLGLIVVCTFSGDYLFPPAAARLHRDLGARGGQIFDVQANCAGFVTGVTAAADRMRADPELRFALVVGVEVSSPFTDWSDVETAIYFSDGAGAAVLGHVDEGRGIQASAFFTDTANFDSVRLRGGGSAFPYPSEPPVPGERSPRYMEMNGLATWKQAVTHLPPTIRRACDRAGIALTEVDQFVFHQANLHIIQYAMQKMRVLASRAFVHVTEIGNTGSASIAIALNEIVRTGRIADGNKIVLAGVGAGFNFGASAWIWGGASGVRG